MIVKTSEYENTHGKKPRGRALWAITARGSDGRGRYTTETYYINGSLPYAKKEAVRQMKQEIGGVKMVTSLEILP